MLLINDKLMDKVNQLTTNETINICFLIENLSDTDSGLIQD